MECQLGDKAHDDSTRRRQKRHLQMSVCRLQGRARVHRRLHLLIHEEQGHEPDTRRRAFPQTNWRMAVMRFKIHAIGFQDTLPTFRLSLFLSSSNEILTGIEKSKAKEIKFDKIMI